MPEIEIAPLAKSNRSAVLHIDLPPDQQVFGGDIAVESADDDPETDFHVLRHTDRIVGFFKIERAYGARYDFAPEGVLGLRMLQIDAPAQGQGLGKALFAALPDYLAATYPQASECWLTVNCRNLRARHVYLAGGWQDTGEVYLDGGAGPQHIMRLILPRTARARRT